MSDLPASLFLEEEMGIELGAGSLLQRTLPQHEKLEAGSRTKG
ncbi:MAG: hypothetical protein P8X60_04940 [Robiginitalea sp.]|jgi:hypothetical protein